MTGPLVSEGWLRDVGWLSDDEGRRFDVRRDGMVDLLDAFSGQIIVAQPTSNRAPSKRTDINWVRLGPDKLRVAISTTIDTYNNSGRSTIEVWSIAPETRPWRELEVLAEWLAGHMLDESGKFKLLSEEHRLARWEQISKERDQVR